MNVIYSAIYNKVQDTPNAFYTSIGGRYYTEVAPQPVTFPYVVGHLITVSQDDTFTEFLDNVSFQFNIYSNIKQDCGLIEIGGIYTDLKTIFDDAILSVTGYTHYYMLRQTANPRWIPKEEVWQYVVEYSMIVEKSRT